MKKFIVVVNLVVLFIFLRPYNGGAMAERPIKDNFQEKIDLSDGVNKEEAIILAKNYLIQKGLEKNVIISKPKVRESRLFKECWAVYFPPSPKMRAGGPFDFVVDVNKNTGEIKLAGWNK